MYWLFETFTLFCLMYLLENMTINIYDRKSANMYWKNKNMFIYIMDYVNYTCMKILRFQPNMYYNATGLLSIDVVLSILGLLQVQISKTTILRCVLFYILRLIVKCTETQFIEQIAVKLQYS